MAKEKDYYKILGVEKGASTEQIKKSYKRMAKKYHPDLNKEDGATEKFKEINEAAAVLSDEQKRQQYDQYGTTFEQFTGHGFDFKDFGFDLGGVDFEDIFERFFGGSFGGRRRKAPRRGADIEYDIEVSLNDVATGMTKSLSIPKLERCDKCHGSGAEKESDIVTCPDCNGSGMQRRTKRTPFGIFSTATTCRKCKGQGKYIKNECFTCDGTGVVKKTKKLEIKIPAGVDTGTHLRIPGEGQAGEKGAESGDLYVGIHVKQHDTFERHGDDLYIKVPLLFTTASLGGEIEVPTLEGKAKLKIPSGTQSNTVFRMGDKGIPHLDSYGKGDQNVEVVVSVPEKLNKKQKELLKEFEKEAKKSGFFKRMIS